jgi:hypothetical protein
MEKEKVHTKRFKKEVIWDVGLMKNGSTFAKKIKMVIMFLAVENLQEVVKKNIHTVVL